MELVFVYGTLRRGEKYHHLLEGARLKVLLAYVPGSLADTGEGYPALLPENEGTRGTVAGELYETDAEGLKRLDQLEDYYGPGDARNLYDRVRIGVRTDQGEREAWTYVHKGGGSCTPIPDNDWKIYRMRQQPEVLYFAYGSCMDTGRIEQAGVAEWFAQVEGRGTLDGFRLAFTLPAAGGSRADIVEAGGCTEGKLYRIPEKTLGEYLYGRERVETLVYRPVAVPVRLENGAVEEALTFVVVHKEEECPPPDWYRDEILRGAKPVVSASYYAALEARLLREF